MTLHMYSVSYTITTNGTTTSASTTVMSENLLAAAGKAYCDLVWNNRSGNVEITSVGLVVTP